MYLEESVQVISINPPFSCPVAGAVVFKSAKDGKVSIWMCSTKESADFCWRCFTDPEPEDEEFDKESSEEVDDGEIDECDSLVE